MFVVKGIWIIEEGSWWFVYLIEFNWFLCKWLLDVLLIDDATDFSGYLDISKAVVFIYFDDFWSFSCIVYGDSLILPL